MDIENDGRAGEAGKPATGRDAQDGSARDGIAQSGPAQDGSARDGIAQNGAGTDQAADASTSAVSQHDAPDAAGAPFAGEQGGAWTADGRGPSASAPGHGPDRSDGPVGQETAGSRGAADGAERRRRPLFGTIVWGVILLAFSGVMAALSMPEVRGVLDVTSFVITVIAGVGVLLVVAGIAASLRRG